MVRADRPTPAPRRDHRFGRALPDRRVALRGDRRPRSAAVPTLPAGWSTGQSAQGVQLVATAVQARTDPEAVPLGPSDVPEMLELVERAKPGPFLPGTVEMGAYYGIRRGGRLVAMAGER